MTNVPVDAERIYLEGLEAAKHGEWRAAARSFRLAVDQMPGIPGIWNDLGTALLRAGDGGAAVMTFQTALAAFPNDPLLLSNLAVILAGNGAFDQSAFCAEQAMELATDACVCVQAANALSVEGRYFGSAIAYRKAIALGGGTAETWANLATSLHGSGMHKEGHAAHLTALSLAPDNRNVQSNLLFSLNLQEDLSPETVAGIHFDWGRAMSAREVPGFDFAGRDWDRSRPLRIGVLSADLRTHSVRFFAKPVVHSTPGYDVCVFSTVRTPDACTERFRNLAGDWVDLAGVSAAEGAKTIFEREIDVLVEMGGHTAPSNLEILARKPAPVQAAYLSYPATSGLMTVDFLMTDTISDPVGRSEHLYTERLVRLDPCMLCYEPSGSEPAIREREPGRRWTFGSFAQRQKISRRILDLWAAVMKQCAYADILLKAAAWRDPRLRAEILDAFEQRGVPGSRIRLLPPNSAVDGHLRTYNEVDLALDTAPYGGITTTCEALWMGVPVLTMRGRSQVSRTCSSILTAAGFENLIAESAEEYVRFAVALATGAMSLPLSRAGIRDRFQKSPVMDSSRFRTQWEFALRRCWEQESASRLGSEPDSTSF